MKQMDLFDETLEKKILRLERSMFGLQQELWFLKETYYMRTRIVKEGLYPRKLEQVNMFGT